jgi:hypothetical protein
MKQRYLLCLLLCGLMLYYALPRLVFHPSEIEGVFSMMWLLLAFLAAAGNLAALLFLPDKQRMKAENLRKKQKPRRYYQ